MRIILDTGVFFRPVALAQLKDLPETVIVPAVAMAERVRQLARDGRDEAKFHEGIEESGFVPEPLSPDAACRIARLVPNDERWRRLSRDALIAAHLRPGDQLWTTNPKDFRELGVPEAAIITVI